MKPYPGILDNATLEELLARRRSGLEPRDDSVPAALQDEDQFIPRIGYACWLAGIAFVIVLVLVLLVVAVVRHTLQTS